MSDPSSHCLIVALLVAAVLGILYLAVRPTVGARACAFRRGFFPSGRYASEVAGDGSVIIS